MGVDAIAPEIRLLSPHDLDGAFALSSTAGWNQRGEDWSMLLGLAPRGSFAAVSQGRIVATAIGIDYGAFGWIAMMLVDPAFRGRGIGRRLLEAAIEALPPDRPVRLDATPMGRPLYEAHGFRLEEDLTRYMSGPVDRSAFEPRHPGASAVDRMAADDLAGISERDAATFHGDRRRLLEWARSLAPHYCYVLRTAGGPAGYCFGREGRLCDQVGPVVAETGEAACALAAAALASSAGRQVFVDAFDARAGFPQWLQSHGFTAQRPLYRMCRPAAGQSLARTGSQRFVEHAIFGPEFA